VLSWNQQLPVSRADLLPSPDRLPPANSGRKGFSLTDISKVGVVGCGLMGHGITQICAQAGWDVVVREIDQATLDKGIGKIEKQLGKAVEKGKMEQADADGVRGRIQGTLDYSDLAECDLVIEAMTEDLGGKLAMWREVDGIVKESAFFASNTSSLAVVDQAAATSRPEQFLGLHFFNPAQMMPLLEVVRTVTTSDEAFELGLAVGEKLGKTVVPAKDKTGFIVNRLLVPYMLDAIRAYEEGFGSIDEIDTAMKAGANHPMGPLTLADFVGLDTLAAIGGVMFDEYRERRFAAPPTLRKMVAAGWYGRKSGKGFYDYSGEKPVPSELGL
jgi:3-hydroxybutyryl-CoA dehydrogenase